MHPVSNDTLTALLPAWGFFERMGHDRTPAFVTPMEGLTVLLTTPAMPEADDGDGHIRVATAETKQVAQMGGPAFYGFRIANEATVRAHLERLQPRQRKPAPAVALIEGPTSLAQAKSRSVLTRLRSAYNAIRAGLTELELLDVDLPEAFPDEDDSCDIAIGKLQHALRFLQEVYVERGGVGTDVDLVDESDFDVEDDTDPGMGTQEDEDDGQIETQGDAHGYYPLPDPLIDDDGGSW